MIKEIVRARAEIIEVKCPSPHGNSQTDVVLLVTLATQRQKSLIRRDAQYVSRNRIQWRRLVIAAISGSQNPAKMRNLDRCTQARASYGFCYQSGKMRQAHAGGQ